MANNNIVILTYATTPDVPPVEGKFLQLIWRGREYILFSARDLHRFHNEILGRFVADHDIEHHWLDNQALQLDAADLTVIGGGRFRSDTAARTLALSDNSQAYGRFDERGLKQKIAGAESPWVGFSITITE